MDLPSSRSQWASLEWQDAQIQVGRMLNYAGFMKLEEQKLGRGRADLIVYRKIGRKVYIGIIEVKAYQRITLSMQKKALKQACRYLRKLYEIHNSKQNWNKKVREYFIAAVYTKDYPTREVVLTASERRDHLPSELLHTRVFNSSPDRLIHSLRMHRILPDETNIEDYF